MSACSRSTDLSGADGGITTTRCTSSIARKISEAINKPKQTPITKKSETIFESTHTITKLKKVYATLSQAYELSVANNGEYNSWEKKNDIGATAYFNKYWAPYFASTRVCTTYEDCGYLERYPWQTLKGERKNDVAVVDNATDHRISFYLNDGTFISFSGGFYVDLNGGQKPNIYGKDFFQFLCDSTGIHPNHYTASKSFILNRCSKANYDGATCTARLILIDNWEMKEDYPW